MSPLLSRPLLLAVTALVLPGCRSESAQAPQPPAPMVSMQIVAPQRIVVWDTYPGRTQGAREVQVRARVEGILLKRRYVEGQRAEQGQTLFVIDPAPFAVKLRQAVAEQRRAEASLRRAERDWKRIDALQVGGAVSVQAKDNALAARDLGQAELELAQARVAAARIDLDYTQVTASMAGVTSLEVLDEGSLVRPGDLLTTLTQLDPIQVRFALPEQHALAQRVAAEALRTEQQGKQNPGASDLPKPPARLVLPGGEEYPVAGVVDFTDSGVDVNTGMIRARAVFANPQGLLTPGQFVRLRLPLETLEQALVVPEVAIGEGASGPMVYLVDANNQVHAKPVELGPYTEAGQIIRQGLAPGDRVVVQGVAKIRDGGQVTLRETATAGGG